MKHLLKITSAVLVLLLCALGGVFLWRSGFFAALSSQQALQDYISQFAPYSHLCFFRQVPLHRPGQNRHFPHPGLSPALLSR